MKRLVILFLLSSNLLLGSHVTKIESEIIMSMLNALNIQENLSIYTDSKKIEKILLQEGIDIVGSCNISNVAILEQGNKVKECVKIPILTLKYDLLKIYPDSIGSFFWQKGRPNIVFIKSRLIDKKINLSSKFNDFIEENIW